ncbi:hypothetical protein ONJ17_27295, partial [Salmonella enterica subsp. enterica serovar Agona]|nr:hypothetical protein [Salmonella enterica subsp. enterica serovar Agona]
IKELCDANHIELDLVQCRVTEIETYMDGADLICTTARVDRALVDVLKSRAPVAAPSQSVATGAVNDIHTSPYTKDAPLTATLSV